MPFIVAEWVEQLESAFMLVPTLPNIRISYLAGYAVKDDFDLLGIKIMLIHHL